MGTFLVHRLLRGFGRQLSSLSPTYLLLNPFLSFVCGFIRLFLGFARVERAFLTLAPISRLMRAFAALLLVAVVLLAPAPAPGRVAVVFLSFDLELSPPEAVNGSLSSYEAIEVLPELQKVLERQDVPATFFVTGDIVDKHPRAVLDLYLSGFEIAAHGGYYHAGFKDIPLEEQKRRIRQNMDLIGNLTGEGPAGFRAPAHDYDNNTFTALRELGFLYDSSIVGNGSAGLFELPVSVSGGQALNIDYLLRFRGLADAEAIVKSALDDARKTGRPVVMYAHPWAFAQLRNFPKDYRTGPEVLSGFEEFLLWLKSEKAVFVSGEDFVSGRLLCAPEDRDAAGL